MIIRNEEIDGGSGFDWGRTSEDYAKYRDVYPEQFYKTLLDMGLCIKGQRVLDLGTGTGVLPRNMYKYGASFVGTDISESQIEMAKSLSEAAKMNIEYQVASAEAVDYPDDSFDVVTACTCFFYFNHEVAVPRLARLLRVGGKLVIIYMAWLPYEDDIARQSEELILKYNPKWTGAGETRHPTGIPQIVNEYFNLIKNETYELDVPFTRESWNGRMKACRAIGATLSADKIAAFEKEHKKLLAVTAPESFTVKHYVAYAVLEVKK